MFEHEVGESYIEWGERYAREEKEAIRQVEECIEKERPSPFDGTEAACFQIQRKVHDQVVLEFEALEQEVRRYEEKQIYWNDYFKTIDYEPILQDLSQIEGILDSTYGLLATTARGDFNEQEYNNYVKDAYFAFFYSLRDIRLLMQYFTLFSVSGDASPPKRDVLMGFSAKIAAILAVSSKNQTDSTKIYLC